MHDLNYEYLLGDTHAHVDVLRKHVCLTCCSRLLVECLSSWRRSILLRLHWHVAKIHLKKVVGSFNAGALNVRVPCVLQSISNCKFPQRLV